ncbi:MAG: hypothetical protein IKD77_05110 [Bacilli bacterium]|nr:hypothetical protein [Bacilli bacterium]
MKIIAHRAHTEKYKDNSLKSILYSLNQNYIDGIEIDIRMTKDFKFVLNHDPFYKPRSTASRVRWRRSPTRATLISTSAGS